MCIMYGWVQLYAVSNSWTHLYEQYTFPIKMVWLLNFYDVPVI